MSFILLICILINKMKRRKIFVLLISCLCTLLIGCNKSSLDIKKTVKDYTFSYQSEQSGEVNEAANENVEETAEKGYYESLVQSKSCQWNKPLAYPNLKDESQFDANDYTNWASAAVESAMVKDGYSVFFQDLNLCKGEKFYGLGAHEMRGSGQQVTAGYQGRIYIMMTVAGGAFDLSVEDGEGTVLWEQENVTESNQIFLDIDEMPESVIGVLTDHTKEEDKEKLFYSVMILAAVEREATE